MPERDGLTPADDPTVAHRPKPLAGTDHSSPEDELLGPDWSREHASLYVVLFGLLVAGSLLLQQNTVWLTGSEIHTLVESVATVLAFIIGGLALVRYYSRKRITFLLIGCGFLGAALLDLNHALVTSEVIVELRQDIDSYFSASDLFAWTWTAERVFLSIFLFFGLLAWGREVGEGKSEARAEVGVYANALGLTLINLLFFEWVPLEARPFDLPIISRPFELVPAAFFAFAFVGFYRKGGWRRDPFEHWLLVFLLISVFAHAGYMVFSEREYDAMFDAAHLLKVASYVAILAGLMSSVYETFRRESEALDALTESNDALAHEIEVRRHTEEAVKESSQRLQDFLDTANDLIQSVAADGRILYVNSSWKRVLGYSDEDLERLNLFEIVHPAHRRRLEKEFERILQGADPSRFDVEYVASDGRIVMLSGSVQAQKTAGRTIATQSILRDVTEQRLAERQLDESQRNLEALVENTGDSIWSVDRQHRLITLNSAFALAMEARTGSEPKVGQLPEEILLPEDVEWYEQLYDRTLSGERHVALRTDDVDGQLRYFELYANPIQALEGVSGAVFFGKDVTPRVRAEEALVVAKEEAEAANKAKSDFLANMSHELRTPLNSVIGFTNILLKNKDGRLNDKDLGFLQRVLSNGKHLLALINEVLDLAKVEAGRMELIIEEVDLAHLCVETVQQLEGQAKTKDGKVALLAEVPEHVATVETDSAKLKQVIINLVGNALKFTHEGSVTVALELGPDGKVPVAIAVKDTGIGIPDDRLEAIFEAFQQAEAGTSRKYGGTGLGLALSRSICLLMGYDLIVESEVGKGSTFKIVLGERAERPVREVQDDDDVTEVSSVPQGTPTEGVADAVEDSAGSGGPAAADVGRGPRPGHMPEGSRTQGAVGIVASAAEGAPPAGAEEGRGGAPASDGGEPGPGPKPTEEASPVGGGDHAGAVEGSERGDAPESTAAGVAAPTDSGGSPPAAVEAAAPPPSGRRSMSDFKVLCVDDEKDSRVLIAHYLEEFGCQVMTAANGEQCLRLAREHHPDLVTLDLIMPGMTGWEVLKRMKADPEIRSIPVVVVSVVAGDEGRGSLLGAVDLVTKPFEREDLLRVLWRHLGRTRAGRVLLMVGEDSLQAELRDFLSGRGLEVVAAERGSAPYQALAAEAPDALLLDLSMEGVDPFVLLERLRGDRLYRGLPIFALAGDDLPGPDQDRLRDLATVVVPRGEPVAALDDLLGVLFPIADTAGQSG